MNRVQYLDLLDFLLIAEAVLETEVEVLLRTTNLSLADMALHAPAAGSGEVEFYPEFAQKAAVLGSRLCRNHPLIDGNKRVAFECMLEFVERNGRTWTAPPGDAPEFDETVGVIVALAASELSEEEFVQWVTQRISGAIND